MARVLWIGDAGCHTGFARVTHSIGDRLVDNYGHDIHVLAFNHRGDWWPTSLKLYRPNTIRADDIWGRARIVELLAKVEPEVVVMLHDPSLLISLFWENQYDTQQYLLRYRPVITYIPVDGTNQPPQWRELLEPNTNVITMSRFGQTLFPESKMVYHGVDTDQFWPVSAERPITTSNGIVCTTKKECKAAFDGIDPDGFLILRADKNSGRKDWAATIKAVWPVMKRHSDVQMFMHTQSHGDESALLIPAMLAREPSLKDRFKTPDLANSFVGWPQEDLNCLFNAADLFVTTSRGEGFGLTIAEAMSCGVPVIAQNVSAIPEVVGDGGVLLEPAGLITVPPGQDLWLPDIPAFTEAIEHLYNAGGVRRKLGVKAREHVVRSFSWDDAAARFNDFIGALASGSGTSELNAADTPKE